MFLQTYIELFKGPFYIVTLYNCRSHYLLYDICKKYQIDIFHHGYYRQYDKNSEYSIGHGTLDRYMATSYVVCKEYLQQSMDTIKQQCGVGGKYTYVERIQRNNINTLIEYTSREICSKNTIMDSYAEYPPNSTLDNYLSKYDSNYYYVCILGGCSNHEMYFKKLFQKNNCEFVLDEENSFQSYESYSEMRYYVHEENLRKSINILINDTYKSFDIYKMESKENHQKRIDDFNKFFSTYSSPPVKVTVTSRINKSDIDKIHAFNNMHHICQHIYNYTTYNLLFGDVDYNGMNTSFYVAEEKYNEVKSEFEKHIGSIVPYQTNLSGPIEPIVSGEIKYFDIDYNNCAILFDWYVEKLVSLEDIQ